MSRLFFLCRRGKKGLIRAQVPPQEKRIQRTNYSGVRECGRRRAREKRKEREFAAVANESLWEVKEGKALLSQQ